MFLPVFLQLLVATVVVSAPTQSIQRRDIDGAPLTPPTGDPLLENAPFPIEPVSGTSLSWLHQSI
jgi:hypothetical protein